MYGMQGKVLRVAHLHHYIKGKASENFIQKIKDVKAKALSRETKMSGSEGLAKALSLLQRCLNKRGRK
ncbi:MAG: hypothetical protein A2252_11840 [Elusimicrobia bacterium RIFOXYA2_FULL_39_19]|nr:MAG: hypothetical protein A2252_11840 [Elusimicrobia bacterium RIFOXYA2_FULL_39_19]